MNKKLKVLSLLHSNLSSPPRRAQGGKASPHVIGQYSNNIYVLRIKNWKVCTFAVFVALHLTHFAGLSLPPAGDKNVVFLSLAGGNERPAKCVKWSATKTANVQTFSYLHVF